MHRLRCVGVRTSVLRVPVGPQLRKSEDTGSDRTGGNSDYSPKISLTPQKMRIAEIELRGRVDWIRIPKPSSPARANRSTPIGLERICHFSSLRSILTGGESH